MVPVSAAKRCLRVASSACHVTKMGNSKTQSWMYPGSTEPRGMPRAHRNSRAVGASRRIDKVHYLSSLATRATSVALRAGCPGLLRCRPAPIIRPTPPSAPGRRSQTPRRGFPRRSVSVHARFNAQSKAFGVAWASSSSPRLRAPLMASCSWARIARDVRDAHDTPE